MSIIAPTAPTAAPTVPDRSNRATFSGLMFTMFLYIKDNLVSEMYGLAQNAWGNAVDSANSASIASQNAAIAFSAAGVTLWVSGTTYTLGQAVISPSSLLVYRRKVAGAGTTDPVSDATNWKVNSMAPQWVTKTANYTAVDGDALRCDTTASTFTVTLPAAPLDNATVAWKDFSGTFGTNKLTFGRNGKNIMGLAQDMDVSTSNFNGVLTFIAATNDWRF